jgi:hypothetical protein
MDTVLPSAGSYQVSALVNRSSLDECSIIAAGDTVLPYFSNSVAGDPDLANLVVYLEDSWGNRVGRRVRYSTGPVPAVQDLVEAGDLPESGAAEPGKTEAGDGTQADWAGSFKDPSFADGLLIPVDGFIGQLPPFPVTGDIASGYYTMVFEIRGKQDLLSRVERRIFYTGNSAFTIGGIRYYLPSFDGDRHLVSQGLNVMLEVRVDYGADLEPYVVWYNGSRRIGEGFVNGGTARLLWKAAQQTGFHTIRAEVFPFEPQAGVKGMVRELSLPVSSGVRGDSSISIEDFLYYYQLAGDLREMGTGAELDRTHAEKAAPLWYPAEQIYGLALENGNSYEALPNVLDFSAISSGDKTGQLRFFIRFFPLGEGTILSALLGEGAHSVAVRLFLRENALYFELEGEDKKILSDPLAADRVRNSFMGVALDLEIRGTGIRAFLTPADSPLPLDSLPSAARPGPSPETGDAVPPPPEQRAADVPFLELDNPPGGELRSWLGEAEPLNTGEAVPENPAGPLNDKPAPLPVAVVDDFSALFRVSDQAGESSGAADRPAADSQTVLQAAARTILETVAATARTVLQPVPPMAVRLTLQPAPAEAGPPDDAGIN